MTERQTQEPHFDARPGKAPDRSVETSLNDTFPASDPQAATTTVGARVVHPSEALENVAPITDTTPVSAEFPDRETAKLAVEDVVRNAPLDPRRAGIALGGDKVTVTVQATEAGADKVAALLEKDGGTAT